jgi:hypothetical protein
MHAAQPRLQPCSRAVRQPDAQHSSCAAADQQHRLLLVLVLVLVLGGCCRWCRCGPWQGAPHSRTDQWLQQLLPLLLLLLLLLLEGGPSSLQQQHHRANCQLVQKQCLKQQHA